MLQNDFLFSDLNKNERAGFALVDFGVNPLCAIVGTKPVVEFQGFKVFIWFVTCVKSFQSG
jgi:hypothetical protein